MNISSKAAFFVTLITFAAAGFFNSLRAQETAADLTDLQLSGATLTPAFARTTAAYSAAYPFATTSTTLSGTFATPVTAAVRTRLNGAPSQPGLPASFQLRVGQNFVSLSTTANGAPLDDFTFAAGINRNLARSASGAVMHSQVVSGGPSLPELPIESQSGVVGVFAGSYGEYALKNDGTLLALSGAAVPPAAQPDAAASPPRAPIVAVSVGTSHAVLLRSDGTTFAWGNSAVTTIPNLASSGVVALSSGSNHLLALRADGHVIGWGESINPDTYVARAARSEVVAIASNGGRNLALKADGSVVHWGGTNSTNTPPVAAQSGVVAIAAGSRVNLALKADGSVVAWGDETNSALIQPPAATTSGVVAIAAGPRHQLALKSDGSIVAWGAGANGSGTAIAPAFPAPFVEPPVRSYYLTVQRRLPSAALAYLTTVGNGALSPDFAPETTAFSTNNSTAYPAFALHGSPFSNHARLELRTGSETFRPVTAGQAMEATSSSGISLLSDGSVRAWGTGNVSQVPLAAQSDVVSVSADAGIAVALKSDGTVVAWGALALPSFNTVKASAVFVNTSFLAAIAPDGRPVILPTPGGLGLGSTVITFPADARDLTDIALSYISAIALRRDGRVVGWGLPNDIANVPVAARSDVVDISLGAQAFALRSDGRVVAWGSSSAGLAFGTERMPLAATYGVVGISASRSRAAVLKADGSALGWDSSSGAIFPLAGPRELPDIASVVAGPSGFYAILRDGSVQVLSGSVPTGAPSDFLTAPLAVPLSARLPLALGNNTIQLRATARDDSATLTYTIQANRTAAPALALVAGTDLAPINQQPDGVGQFIFGLQRVGLASSERLFTVANTGTADLVLTAADFIGSAPTEFSFAGISFPLTIGPSTSTTFTLRATPSTSGDRFAVLRLHANLPHGGPHHISLRVTGLTAASELATWRTANFSSTELAAPSLEATVWGDLADPDADGLPNLLEYATNTAPKTANLAPSVVLDVTTNPATPRLVLTYTRVLRAVTAGLVYRVEWSDDLAANSWSDVGVTEQITATTSTTETVVASVPLSSATRRFLRLRVTAP
jgi:alpha-tubulin suppressor-like RCC1 family protein